MTVENVKLRCDRCGIAEIVKGGVGEWANFQLQVVDCDEDGEANKPVQSGGHLCPSCKGAPDLFRLEERRLAAVSDVSA